MTAKCPRSQTLACMHIHTHHFKHYFLHNSSEPAALGRVNLLSNAWSDSRSRRIAAKLRCSWRGSVSRWRQRQTPCWMTMFIGYFASDECILFKNNKIFTKLMWIGMLCVECSRIEKLILVIKVRWSSSCGRQHVHVCRLVQCCTAANC